MVGEPYRALVTLAQDGEEVQPQFFGRRGIDGTTLKDGQFHSGRLDLGHHLIQLGERAHAAGQHDRFASGKDAFQQRLVGKLARRQLPSLDAQTLQQFHCLQGERRTEEQQTALFSVRLQPSPLFLSEFHSPPVIITRRILAAELDPPRLAGSAFGGGYMGLKLDRIRPSTSNGIYVGVSGPKAAIVRLGDFADNQAMPRCIHAFRVSKTNDDWVSIKTVDSRDSSETV